MEKNTATVTINGVEKEISFSHIGAEDIIGAALGLVQDPTKYLVSWKHGTREGRMLPSERMFPEQGMEFTVSRR